MLGSTEVTIDAQTGGTNAVITAASSFSAGVLLPADWNKLNGGTSGWVTTAMLADGGVTLAKLDTSAQTTISVSTTATTVDLGSSTGGGDSIPAATGTSAGCMTGTDKKLFDGAITNAFQDNVAVTGAFNIDAQNATAGTLLVRLNLTGNATPTITLPPTPQKITFMIDLNGFTLDWSSMPLHPSVTPPNLIDGQQNFVEFYTSSTQLFYAIGAGV